MYFEEKEAKSQTYAQKSSSPGEFASVWISMPLCAKGFLCAVSGFGEVSSPSFFSSSLSPTPFGHLLRRLSRYRRSSSSHVRTEKTSGTQGNFEVVDLSFRDILKVG